MSGLRRRLHRTQRGSSEDRNPQSQAHSPAPSHPLSQGGCQLRGETFKYQGEEVKRDRPPHYRPACLFLSLPSPSCSSSLSLPPALLSLLSPSPFFSASSPGFLVSSLIFLLPYSHSLLCVAVLTSGTVLSVFPTVAALERGRVREQCACVRACGCVCWLELSIPRQDFSCIINTESFPGPSQYRTNGETFWMEEGLGPCLNVLDFVFLGVL